jgi:hypothetical protein
VYGQASGGLEGVVVPRKFKSGKNIVENLRLFLFKMEKGR